MADIKNDQDYYEVYTNDENDLERNSFDFEEIDELLNSGDTVRSSDEKDDDKDIDEVLLQKSVAKDVVYDSDHVDGTDTGSPDSTELSGDDVKAADTKTDKGKAEDSKVDEKKEKQPKEKAGVHIGVSADLPMGFSMDTAGILTCSEPVTAASLEKLLDYVEENRDRLAVEGRWSEPSTISFNPRDAADGNKTVQRFDHEIAAVINSRLPSVHTIELRNGSVDVVRNEKGENPLNEIQRLGHVHCYSGVSNMRDLLGDCKRVHFSMGLTGSRTNEIKEGELSGINPISFSITGGAGQCVSLNDNAFSKNPIHAKDGLLGSKSDFRQSLNELKDADGISYEEEKVLSVRDTISAFLDANFKEEREFRVGTSLWKALDKMDASIDKSVFTDGADPVKYLKGQIGAVLGMDPAETEKASNREFARNVADIINTPFLKTMDQEAFDRVVAVMTSDASLNALGVQNTDSERNVAAKDIKDGAKALRKLQQNYESGKIGLQDANIELKDLLDKYRLFGKIFMEGSMEIDAGDDTKKTTKVSDIFMDGTGLRAVERLDNLAENVCACYETRDGARSFKGFRILDSDDMARDGKENRDLDSKTKESEALAGRAQKLDDHMRRTGIREKNNIVKTNLLNLSASVLGLAAVYKRFDQKEIAEKISRSLKTSAEVKRNGQTDNVGKSIFINGNMSLGVAAFAGRDESFYNKGGEVDFMFAKLGSELMESMVKLSANVNKKCEKLQEDMKQGKYVDPLELEALQILRNKIDVNGINTKNEISEKMRLLKMNMDVIKNSSIEQDKLLKDAVEKGEALGIGPKKVKEIFRDALMGKPVADSNKNEKMAVILDNATEYAKLQEGAESKRKAFITTMAGLKKHLGDALVPQIYTKDADGRQVLGEDGMPKTENLFGDVLVKARNNIFGDEPFRELDLNDQIKEFYDGITEVDVDVARGGKIGSAPMPVQFLSTWRNFSEFSGLDTMNPDPKDLKPVDKVLMTSAGTVLDDASLMKTGITCLQERRESEYKHEFDKIHGRNEEARNEASAYLNDIRKTLGEMNVPVGPGGNADWERVFKPAFDQLAADPTLQPETVNAIKLMANTTMVACSRLEESEKWLSENPDHETYRCNQSPIGAKFNEDIKRLKGMLATDDITQDQRNYLENELGSLLEQKDAFIQDGMKTICGDTVSEEADNVSMESIQKDSNTCAFPYTFCRNDSNGKCPKVALNEKPPIGEVLWGTAVGTAQDFAAYGKRFMTHYRHMSVPESLMKILAVALKAVFNTLKLFFNAVRLGTLQHEIDKADAYSTMWGVMNKKFDGKAPIQLRRPGKMGGVYEFTSKEAEDFCRSVGVTMDNSSGRTVINVNLTKATGGKAVGDVSLSPDRLMKHLEDGTVPRCVTNEKTNRQWMQYAKEAIHDWTVQKANTAHSNEPKYAYANQNKEAERQKKIEAIKQQEKRADTPKPSPVKAVLKR